MVSALVLAIVLIVIVAVAGGGAFFVLHGSTSSNPSNSGSSSGNGGSSGNSGSGSSGNSGSSSGQTGAGTPLILESQATSLFGSGGQYNETSVPSSDISEVTAGLPASLSSTISEAWVLGYSYPSGSNPYAVIETVYETSNPSELYGYVLQNSTSSGSSSLSVINQTYGNMEYSYGVSTSFLNATALIAESGNYVAEVLEVGLATSQNPLVSTVYSDLS